MKFIHLPVRCYHGVAALAIPAIFAGALNLILDGRNWCSLSELQLLRQLPGAFWVK